MRLMKSSLCLSLTWAIILSPVTPVMAQARPAATPAPVLLSTELNAFVEEISADYDYSLPEIELKQVFEMSGLTAIRTTVGDHARQKQGKNDASQEQRTARIEKNYERSVRASQIIERIYSSQSVSEFNLSMLVLAHFYLHSSHPKVKGALRQVVGALAGKIDETYFRNLEKKSKAMAQVNTGTFWTLVALTVASIARPVASGTKGLLTQTQEKLAVRFVRQARPTKAREIETALAAGAAADGPVSNTAAIETLRRMGAIIEAPTAQAVKQSTPSRLVLRDAIAKYLSKQTAKARLKNLMLLVGASYTGGAVYSATRKAQAWLDTPDIGDQYVDPTDIFNRDYNGLAVLSLQCDIKGLLNQKTIYQNDKKTTEGFWTPQNLSRLNLILADYQLLLMPEPKDKVPRYIQKTTLPMTVKFVDNSWQASFEYMGKKIIEVIPCAAMTHLKGKTQLEISLEEAILDIDALNDRKLARRNANARNN